MTVRSRFDGYRRVDLPFMINLKILKLSVDRPILIERL